MKFIKQIYTCINDKLVGLLLRARKYKFVDFEGGMDDLLLNLVFLLFYLIHFNFRLNRIEMLFQRRDDNVPIFMLKTVDEIKQFLNGKIEEVRRSQSPNPQATSLLINN